MDPSIQISSAPILPTLIAVLSASLAGSFHCVAMCGGLTAIASGESKKSLYAYHFARLLGYLLLGSAAGYLGHQLVDQEFSQVLSWASAGLIALALIISGINLFRGRSLHISGFTGKLIRKLVPSAMKLTGAKRAASIGISSVFLPCGWLYTFVVAAASTQSLWAGGAVLLAFWMGTLPALLASGLGLNFAFSKLQGFTRTSVAILLVILGIATLSSKINKIPNASAELGQASCHETHGSDE